MARERVYRDYWSEDDTARASPLRSPSLKQTLASSDTLRAIGANGRADNEKKARFGDYGIGIGIARTIDEDATTPSEYESTEPVLDEAQVDPHDAAPMLNPFPAELDGFEVDSLPADIDVDEARDFSPVPTHEPRTFSPASNPDRRTLSPSNVHLKSAFTPSLTTASTRSVSHDAQSSGASSGSKMPEFFGHTIFQTALHNPTIAHQLFKFGESRLCGENMAFLARVSKYQLVLNEVAQAISEIHKEFLTNNAPSHINIAEQLQSRVNSDVKRSLTSTLPALESVFANTQDEIERLVYTDIYPKFVRQQLAISAAKALGGDRSKYAGLGDCFVLTDPAKADNPIVFASDGFVKVTGYTRNEIIPRNCRFLQSRQTDKSAVRRLKAAIEKREESVELILNTKKNGEPFWNLLYTTPLFDGHGNLVFFLGGQINCSTTIHSASDILRILAQTNETEQEATPGAMSPQPVEPPGSRRGLLGAFRTRSKPTVPQRAPGMENGLLDRLGEKDLRSQMRSFYTAYSNVSLIFLIHILLQDCYSSPFARKENANSTPSIS